MLSDLEKLTHASIAIIDIHTGFTIGNNINKIDSQYNCKLNGKMKNVELQVLGGVY